MAVGIRRWTSCRVLVVGVTLVLVALVLPGGRAEAGTLPELVDLTVTGAEVSTYPAFAPDIARFGVRTGATTDAIVVTATANAGDELTVAGVPAASGEGVAFSSVQPGHEITVRVTNGSGTRTYGLVYLPPGFPTLEVTTLEPGVADGMLFMTPGNINVILDNQAVPVYLDQNGLRRLDFKPQPTGQYTFLERTSDVTSTGRAIFEGHVLDSFLNEVATHRNVAPLTHTDPHEVLLFENGHRIMVAYEPTEHDGVVREDSVIQEVDETGTEVFRWSSWGDIPLADNLSGNLVEYAHINSVSVDADGHLLASLRGTSQVVKINRDTGAVMWKLGGVSSDYAIADPFCGQHTASRLANGNILVFDNGIYCPPDASTRGESRAAEYQLDDDTMTATLVWSHQQGIYGRAQGSTQRLGNGNTLIGWGFAGHTTEVASDGTIVFDVAHGGSRSYRAWRFPFDDTLDPTPAIESPGDGAVFRQGRSVRADYACFDRGGSSLESCGAATAYGEPIDTSTHGKHDFTVTATDRAGNTAETTHSYTVVRHRPDNWIRRKKRSHWRGNNIINGTGDRQSRTASVRPLGWANFLVRVQNDGNAVDSFKLKGTAHGKKWRVTYYAGTENISKGVKAGTYRVNDLRPGRYTTLRVKITAKSAARPGDQRSALITARSVSESGRRDAVKATVKQR